MADNYLEKRYDEIFGHGGNSAAVRSHAPGIEALLRKMAEDGPFNPAYKVMDIQMEAITRVARMLPADITGQLEIKFQGDEIFIEDKTVEGNERKGVATGIALQSMLFKAAEMGLRGKVTFGEAIIVKIGR